MGQLGDSFPQKGYQLQLMFFIMVALVSALLSFINIFLDKKYLHGKMNSSGDELARINKRIEAMEKGEEVYRRTSICVMIVVVLNIYIWLLSIISPLRHTPP